MIQKLARSKGTPGKKCSVLFCGDNYRVLVAVLIITDAAALNTLSSGDNKGSGDDEVIWRLPRMTLSLSQIFIQGKFVLSGQLTQCFETSQLLNRGGDTEAENYQSGPGPYKLINDKY